MKRKQTALKIVVLWQEKINLSKKKWIKEMVLNISIVFLGSELMSFSIFLSSSLPFGTYILRGGCLYKSVKIIIKPQPLENSSEQWLFFLLECCAKCFNIEVVSHTKNTQLIQFHVDLLYQSFCDTISFIHLFTAFRRSAKYSISPWVCEYIRIRLFQHSLY